MSMMKTALAEIDNGFLLRGLSEKDQCNKAYG